MRRSARCWRCWRRRSNLNIVAANDIDALISITLRDVPLEEALTAILSVANYTWVQRRAPTGKGAFASGKAVVHVGRTSAPGSRYVSWRSV